MSALDDKIKQVHKSLLVMASANGSFVVKEACKMFAPGEQDA